MPLEHCVRWIEQQIKCEVYILQHDGSPNGFAEFRNGGHIIYLLADVERTDPSVILEILAHEAGHVLYNRKRMSEGDSYEAIVSGTQAKLNVFQQLWMDQIISEEEYDRLYGSIEEEWLSNKEKEWILKELKQLY